MPCLILLGTLDENTSGKKIKQLLVHLRADAPSILFKSFMKSLLQVPAYKAKQAHFGDRLLAFISSHLPLKLASWQHDPHLETCRVHILTVFSWIFLADHVTTTLAQRSLVSMGGTLGFPSPQYSTSSTFSKFPHCGHNVSHNSGCLIYGCRPINVLHNGCGCIIYRRCNHSISQSLTFGP
jgi:hypothetical protein